MHACADQTFSAMLHYLYTRQNPPGTCLLFNFAIVVDVCVVTFRFLVERLTADPGKCQELLALADEYLLTDLKEYVCLFSWDRSVLRSAISIDIAAASWLKVCKLIMLLKFSSQPTGTWKWLR